MMKVTRTGRTPQSIEATQALVSLLENYGEVKEEEANIFLVDRREMLLVAYSSQAYYERRGYYWFSLAKTKYLQILNWQEDHAWLVLLCGLHGRYFVPIGEVKFLLSNINSNRRDGRWDMYIRFEGENAFFGVTRIENQLNVTNQFQHFEQLWQAPAIEETYVDEAIYIPDSLPEPNRKMGQVVRVVRNTSQSSLVKELYDFKCQICGWTAYSPLLKNHWYCEAHHVQPLGRKYGGPDHFSNILALCPNHHCMMDLGILAIEPERLGIVFTNDHALDINQQLILKREHGLNQRYLQFHFDKIFIKASVEIPISSNSQLPM
jgi:hypothetical protein